MAEIPERISVNTRYQGVWNQTTAAVMERYRIFFQYAAVVLALLGIAVSKDGARILALAIPYISLLAALILTHIEIITELLTEDQRRMVETYGLQGDRPRTEEWNFDESGARWTIRAGVFLHMLPILFTIISSSFAAFRITRGVLVYDPTVYLIRIGMLVVTGILMVLVIAIRWWRVERLGKAQERTQRMTDTGSITG
ncbi:MAG: hypothetical protein HY221_01795 [Candidatus Sungbacteria bacterium]|uniref:Uncharacterized protein n=1 Tax=Candidatus Sungiibacteriota bacterium TaxID=2750080 RepID=A0A932R255_9BACT|nr:hypothetical protein [Candidatus Sungbacteria bacterium]